MRARFSSLLLLFSCLLAHPALAGDRLVALTFDDGPRPYVLFGTGAGNGGLKPTPGLLDVLDRYGVKSTFFVVGWRLTPKTWGEPRHETNIGVTCLEAAARVLQRGHELENHTYSHIELGHAEKRNGEAWVVQDVEHGGRMIQGVSGSAPRYLRPPDWILPQDARHDLERRGYRVLTISNENPLALRDVNSLDYLCAGNRPVQCPKPSLAASVLRQIEQREKKGVYTHILAFHELTSTTAALPELIRELQARGYRFVTLSEYMKLVQSPPAPQQLLKTRVAASPLGLK
jgi:peptidoglycan/xylan/chitin deacetylase (PgdA/CDA1 family)